MARRVEVYQALVVPGLLQTSDYGRALFEAVEDVVDVDQGVAMRLERQKILDSEEPPQLRVLLKQSVLEDPVGGPVVMKAQLAHLLKVSTRPNVHVRVLPRSKGVHVGLDGSFMLIQGRRGECGYIEAVDGGRLITDPTKLSSLRVRLDRIGDDALPREASRELILRLMERMT
ncbi:hypothetical protein GCM10010191_54800 [Actinomadura vinacea]|uniref:DUF5753 domain-containing protein n=1 Tax=Actinomadura vinacea TaxID=115336 RepID=A0ABP5WQU7_9ACTN